MSAENTPARVYLTRRRLVWPVDGPALPSSQLRAAALDQHRKKGGRGGFSEGGGGGGKDRPPRSSFVWYRYFTRTGSISGTKYCPE